jgi:carboxyl-terminal processing protease
MVAKTMTLKTRLSVLLLSTPILAFVVIGGLMGRASAITERPAGPDETFQHLRVFQDVISLVMSNYVEEVRVDKAMEGALRGLADGLDPDSAYLTAEQVRAVEQNKPLAAGETGIELTRQFYLRVIAAREHSPAAKAGIHTGDYIRAIDDKPTRDMSVFEGMRLLRGQPGSTVKLTVLRGNAAEPHDVSIVREKAATPSVSSKMLADSTGYLRIPAFTPATRAEVERHAGELAKAGATALVIDLRHAAEGAIEHGIATARLFVKSGTIAIKAGREAVGPDKKIVPGLRERIEAQPGDGAITLPAAVLVTAGTSGAAEVFAAALDGNHRADLIGEHTIGRAALQKLVKLPEGRGLWLTYARFIHPAGEPIHGPGLTPDVAVAEPDAEFGEPRPAGDPILDAALTRLRK